MKRGFLTLLALTAIILGYAMYHFQESPQELWNRLMGYSLPPVIQPTPAPTPMAQIAPSPAPVPTPEPTPAVTPSPDPVTWIRQHKDRWPKEVILLRKVNFPAVVDGKVYGRIDIPAGTSVQLYDIEQDQLAVVHGGGGARVPIESTNLVALAQAEMDTAAPAEPPPAAASPVMRDKVASSGDSTPEIASLPKSGQTPAGGNTILPMVGFGALAPNPSDNAATSFVHPGLIVTHKDIERIKAKVAAHQEPWYSAFLDLQRHAPLIISCGGGRV